MEAVIFYFSGTGNTCWCADRIAAGLTQHGIPARTVSIEQIDLADMESEIGSAEVIGLGWPVYGSDLPEPMKQFIDSALPACRDRKLFTFCSQMMFSGNGARVYEHELAARGWSIGWSAHFNMPNNICVTAFRVPYLSDPAKLTRRLKQTGKTIERFVRAIANGKRYDRGRGPIARMLGAMQRNPYRKWYRSLKDDVSVDPDICTLCGRCVRNCPSGNLVLENGHISTRGTCVLCVRCYNFCPVQAIRYRGKLHLEKRGTPYRGPVPGFRPEVVAKNGKSS